MEYQAIINGIAVNASYSEESVEQIFIPLLQKFTLLQKEKHGRILVMLAAPPAAGKSTLLSFLEHLSRNTEGVSPITAIGMDGFHRYQDYLLSHTLMRDGKEISMVDVKGTPETFDLEKLTAAIAQVSTGAECGWPTYNRLLHNPTEDALRVKGDIVILEGNYLLLNWEGWRDLRQYADFTMKIVANEKDLRDRLISRKAASGANYADAVKFVEFSDLYNARICLRDSMEADLTLTLQADGEYILA